MCCTSPGQGAPSRVRRSTVALCSLELTVSSRLRSRAQNETWLGPYCWEPFVWRWFSSALSLLCFCLPVERALKSQTEARSANGERRDKIGTMAVTPYAQRASTAILYFRTLCHKRPRSGISATSNLPKLAPGLLSPIFPRFTRTLHEHLAVDIIPLCVLLSAQHHDHGCTESWPAQSRNKNGLRKARRYAPAGSLPQASEPLTLRNTNLSKDPSQTHTPVDARLWCIHEAA